MMIYQAAGSKRLSLLERLRSIPLSMFSRLLWPVMRTMMPKTVHKRAGAFSLTLKGRKMSHFLRYVDLWEPRYRRSIMRHVFLGASVLELGSAYGYYTLLLVDREGPDGRVVAVEPFPPYYEGLVSTTTLLVRKTLHM